MISAIGVAPEPERLECFQCKFGYFSRTVWFQTTKIGATREIGNARAKLSASKKSCELLKTEVIAHSFIRSEQFLRVTSFPSCIGDMRQHHKT